MAAVSALLPSRGNGERAAEVARSFVVAVALALLPNGLPALAAGPGASPDAAAGGTRGGFLTRQQMPPVDTVAGQLLAHAELGTFAKLVEAAGLLGLFTGPGPMTLFAPTDEAFEPYRDGRLEELRSDPQALERFIRYHILEDDIIVVPGGMLTGNGSINPIESVLFWPLQ